MGTSLWDFTVGWNYAAFQENQEEHQDLIGNTRCKLINKACKVNNGFSSSYSESHSTEL